MPPSDSIKTWLQNIDPFTRTRDAKKHDVEYQLLALNRFLADLVQIHDTEQMAQTILNTSEELLQADASAIYLLDADQHSVAQTHIHNLSPEYFQRIARDYRGLPGETVLQTRQMVSVEDVLNDPVYQDRIHFLAEYGWRALMIFPLIVQDEPLGALTVYYHDPHPPNEDELHLAQTLTHAIAIAIHNARLYRQLEDHAAELEQRVFERTLELQASKERIEAIVASVPDALFVLDENNRLVQANQAGQLLLEHAINQHIELFQPAFLNSLIPSESPSEHTILEVKGRAYQGLASLLTIASRPAGLVIVFRDVTRFRELDQMKNQFVSDVSHELRTPLANLTLYLDLLATIEDPSKRNTYLETLQRETGRLAHLIEDLLTISRIEAGRLHINLKPIDVHHLLAELIYDRTLMATGQGLKLIYEPPSTLPVIQSDLTLLNQCLSNLLTNAINYTPPGGVVRLTTSLRHEGATDWLAINISDNGVGILPEELVLIFQRFYRGAASRQTGAPGTGLGLSISKEIIDHMGGRLTVESVPGQGSTFTIWLPVAG